MKKLHPLVEVGGHVFSNLTPFKAFLEAPEPGAGIYIFLGVDISCGDLFFPLYVGQTHDFSQRVGVHHPQYGRAKLQARSGFYIAFYPMPGSSERTRCELERQFIRALQPKLNEAGR